MGKKSTKANKNIYQTSREEAGLTREKASELIGFISPDRIERIESEKSAPQPDEILAMEECYTKTGLCNYYCSNECPIGQKYVPEVQIKELSQITLEMLASLNSLEDVKNRWIEITVDGIISDDEIPDFVSIQNKLEKIALTVDTLQLWVQDMIAKGNINRELLNEYRKKSE